MAGEGEQSFRAVLQRSDRGGGRWVEVPFDARAAFGEARPPVSGTVNGVPLRSRLAVYGGRTYLGLTKEIRNAAGIDVGDELDVVLRLDDGPREVKLPVELAAAFESASDAGERFSQLAFTHRREYAQWVGDAKQAQTRERRARRAVELIREGVRHP
jgi:hypothetical protein